METSIKEKIITETKRIEEDVIHSAKGHFNAAADLKRLHLWLGIPATIIASLSGASTLADFSHHLIVTSILSLITAALAALITFMNPNERASAHLKGGNEYNALKNKLRIFREIECEVGEEEEIKNKLLILSDKRDQLNSELPQVPLKAFRKARKGIEEGEATYKVDAQ